MNKFIQNTSFLSVLMLLFCTSTVYSNCLVSHYAFSGNTNDSKGTNHGTNNGASLTKDRFGNANSAYHFVSSENDYIKIPHTPFFLPNYTYSVWVKPESLPTNGNAFIFLSVGGTGGDQNMQIENNQNNALLGYLTGFTITAYNINGNIRAGVATGKLPVLNKWYHVVATRDNNYYKIYINGCLVSTSPSTNGSLPFYGNSNQGATIGSRNNNSKHFNGDLDEVRIYNCAMNDVEVSELYNEFNPLTITKDTAICANLFKPFKLKANSGFCSYKWFDIKNRNTVLGVDSHLLINVNKTTTFRVFVNTGDSATVTITLLGANVKLPNDTLFCNTFSKTLKVETGHKYLWNTNQITDSIVVNQPGLYWVSVTNSVGCIVKDSILIRRESITKFNLSNDTAICGLFSIQLNINTTGVKYNWNSGQSTKSITVNEYGRYIASLENAFGCISYDTVEIKKLYTPYLNIGKDTFFCGPFSIELFAQDSGVAYKWNTSEVTQTIKVNLSGLYIVEVEYPNGCFNYDSLFIKAFNPPNLNLGSDTSLCAGIILNLNISNYNFIKWNDLSADTNKVISNSGQYFVKVIDENDCEDIDTINVVVLPKAKALFSVDKIDAPLKDAEFVFTNLAQNYNKLYYDLNNGDTVDSESFKYKFLKSDKYLITQYALNDNGCHDTFSLEIWVYDEFIIYIPNAFSPNNDDINSVFKPYFEGISDENYELIVFNRWGEKLFVSNDVNIGWNGKYKDELVMDGVYVYLLKVRTSKRTFKYFKGTFTLLK